MIDFIFTKFETLEERYTHTWGKLVLKDSE